MRYAYIPASHAAHEAVGPGGVPRARTPYPVPEIAGRHPRGPHEAARAAVLLGQRATAAGLAARLTYSRGWIPHAKTGAPIAFVDTCMLALDEPGGRQAIVYWHRPGDDPGAGWSFDSARAWRADVVMFPQPVGALVLRDMIKGDLPWTS